MGNNRKKVFICYHSAEHGGVEKQILDIVRGLSNDFDITVVCPAGTLVSDYIKAGAKHIDLSPSFEADLFYVFKLYRLLKKNSVYVIHSHELKTGSLTTFAGWLAGIRRRIYHVHTPFSEWRYGSVKKYPALIVNTIVNAIVGNIFATDVIALTESIKQIRIKKEFILPSKIRVIPNGVDIDTFSNSLQKRKDARKKFGINHGTFLIGNISRFTAEKGHEYFIKAFALLLKDTEMKDYDIRLLLAGGGLLLDKMKQLVSDLKIKDHVIFTGRFKDSDKAKILHSLDLFVFPTYAEGFGIVLVEAMASSLPILSSDLPVLKDVGVDSIAYFETGNEVNLYESMKHLILNKEMLDEYSTKAKDRTSIFSMDIFWDHYKRLYTNKCLPIAS